MYRLSILHLERADGAQVGKSMYEPAWTVVVVSHLRFQMSKNEEEGFESSRGRTEVARAVSSFLTIPRLVYRVREGGEDKPRGLWWLPRTGILYVSCQRGGSNPPGGLNGSHGTYDREEGRRRFPGTTSLR
jgi:hypothetical protein